MSRINYRQNENKRIGKFFGVMSYSSAKKKSVVVDKELFFRKRKKNVVKLFEKL